MPHNNKVGVTLINAASLANETPDNTEPSRRVAIKQLALLFGVSLSAQAVDVLAKPAANSPPTLKFLNSAELRMTDVIAELIIPATDTPGAHAVD
ncbi:MAG: hypothetical protein EOO68_30420, partial [Moraxellaceae bacterium]